MALAKPTPLPFPAAEGNDSLVQPLQQDLVVEFAEQFTMLQGKFIFCTDREELQDQFAKLCLQNQWTKLYCTEDPYKELVPETHLHTDISSCEAAITGCEALVARTGSIVLSAFGQGRIPSVYAPVHVCVATTGQLVYDILEALQLMKKKYKDRLPSLITFATGPSRTADIEKTLVVGVHGPKEVYCFVIDEPTPSS